MIKLAVPASVRGIADETGSQYVAFGTYDMLHYALPKEGDVCDMKWLEDQHERRHDLDWNYERHPVHCYCPDVSFYAGRDALDEDEYRACPLVVTMVRVSKSAFVSTRLALDLVLSDLQGQIDLIKSRMDMQDTPVVACWNLGNADFLILSRPARLSMLRDLFLALSVEGLCIKRDDGTGIKAEFLSFSSYCAFPAHGGLGARIDEDALREWLNKDSDLQFVDFVDTLASAAVASGKYGGCRFLLGDRDYQLFSNIEGMDGNVASSVVSIAREMLDPNGNSIIQSSSLIPSLPVVQTGSNKEGAQPVEPYGLTWHEIESTRAGVVDFLQDMAKLVTEDDAVFQRLVSCYIRQIQHCVHTLDALYKYAVRLYAAAYQDDVFHIIRGLYGSLAQILKDNLQYMRHLRDERRARDLRERIPKTYVEVMRFVSELQHVFTVLGISPHSHMETYYGSMRSLNASSKLWSSYNGVAKALCRLFPARNEGKVQDCRVLMVPYREKYSQSGRVVPDVYSDSILVLLQLNYQSMFDTKSTVFVIAHELGHYLFNETRRARFGLLLKMYVSNILSNAFADMLEYPLYTLTMATMSIGRDRIEGYRDHLTQIAHASADEELWRKVLCINVCSELSERTCVDLFAKMVDELRGAYSRIAKDVLDQCASDFEENYNAVTEYDAAKRKGSSRYQYYYGSDVMTQVSEFIREWASVYLRVVYVGIAEANAEFLQGIAKYEDAYGISFDHYQLIRLQMYWSDAAEEVPVAPGGNVGPFAEFPGFDKSILELFREIHAETFACKTIGFSLDDYLAHVSSFADTIPNLIKQADDIHRIMVVCETALGDSECCGLLEWITTSESCPFDADVRNKAFETVASIRRRPYYRYIKEYGAKVADGLDDWISGMDSESDEEELLEDIRSFAHNGVDAPGIMWRFWLDVIRDEGE
jgi:hypothetical protein